MIMMMVVVLCHIQRYFSYIVMGYSFQDSKCWPAPRHQWYHGQLGVLSVPNLPWHRSGNSETPLTSIQSQVQPLTACQQCGLNQRPPDHESSTLPVVPWRAWQVGHLYSLFVFAQSFALCPAHSLQHCHTILLNRNNLVIRLFWLETDMKIQVYVVEYAKNSSLLDL